MNWKCFVVFYQQNFETPLYSYRATPLFISVLYCSEVPSVPICINNPFTYCTIFRVSLKYVVDQLNGLQITFNNVYALKIQ